MSIIIDNTPYLEILIENPFLRKKYPENGYVLATIDTGYKGFLLIPRDIYNELDFNILEGLERTLILPDKRAVESIGVYGKVLVPSLKISLEGFIESISGIDEVVVGSDLLRNFMISLDFCTGTIDLKECRK